MINFTSRTAFYMRQEPTDMRNGRNGLAEIIRVRAHFSAWSEEVV